MKIKHLNALLLTIFFTNVFAAAPVQSITTPLAAKPEGAYSQAVKVDLSKGELLFVAGQIARDPKTGQLKEDDIQAATKQALDNIKAILQASGSDMQYIVRTDVFLKDFKDWNDMNKVYQTYFQKGHYPARQAIQSNIENRIEISCIAYVPEK